MFKFQSNLEMVFIDFIVFFKIGQELHPKKPKNQILI